MSFLRGLYSFGGRTSRKACWMTGLAILAAAVICIATSYGTLAYLLRPWGVDPQARIFESIPLFVGDVVMSPVLIVLLALIPLYVRRLHDRNRTGHWVWLGVLLTLSGMVLLSLLSQYLEPVKDVPSWVMRDPWNAAKFTLASFIFGAPVAWLYVAGESFRIATTTSYASELYPHAVLGTVSAIYGVWLIIELGFLRGTPGPNKYGPDPLQTSL